MYVDASIARCHEWSWQNSIYWSIRTSQTMFGHKTMHINLPFRGYYTVARRYEFYVRVARTISHEWAQRTSGILFLPREHKVHIFELFFLLYKHTDDGVFDDLQKISDHFPKISEDFPKLFRRPNERSRTFSENSKNSQRCPKISKDCRRLSRK